MADLASLARMFGTPVTDQYFAAPPKQLPSPSVQPYQPGGGLTDFAKYTQQQGFGASVAQPDMAAARNRTLDSLGPLLAFVPFFMMAKNKKKGLASFARAVAESAGRESKTQTALETWKADQLNRMQQQKYEQAMAQVKDVRSLLEKFLALDPDLAGNPAWQQSWLAGDPTFLAESGWKPPMKAEARDKYQLTEVGGRKVLFDPYTGNVVKDLGPSGGPKEPKAPARSDVVDGAWRRYHQAVGVLGSPEAAWESLSVDDKAILRRDPNKPDPLAGLLSMLYEDPDGGSGTLSTSGGSLVPVPTSAPVPAKKQVPREKYDEMITRAAGNPALIKEIQGKYQPF